MQQPANPGAKEHVDVSSLEDVSNDPSSVKATFKRPVVLVIEDDEDQLMFFRTMITKAGFDVISAMNVIQGMEAIAEGKFHAIVSDVHMPKLDGRHFLKTVRQEERYKNLPIIMITADDSAEMKEKLMEMGADYYCSKKKLTSDLVRMLRELLA